ncbi:Panacea domain-containing protein [Sessilibacter sp. MAH4]
MSYPSIAIANAFLEVGRKEGAPTPLTPMKLLKLVYFAHGWYLALRNEPLIDETVEAWRYGPVVPSIYHASKHFGNTNIVGDLSDEEGNIQRVDLTSMRNADLNDLVHWIWKQYSRYDGVQLSNQTHEPGTPWTETMERYGGVSRMPKGIDIEENMIKQYFANQLKDVLPAGI